MEKVWKALIIIPIFLIVYIIISKRRVHVPESNSTEYELSVIEDKRDSVKEKIDTIIIKLKNNEKHYEETINTISNNDVNEDYIFFINYLKWNRERFDSINNSDTVKRN